MVNKSRIQAHVHMHKDGFHCDHCKKLYLTKRSLVKHNKLHGRRKAFECEQCSQVYAMTNSLYLHMKGKHGEGFHCQCGIHFDSPAQHKHHERKCSK